LESETPTAQSESSDPESDESTDEKTESDASDPTNPEYGGVPNKDGYIREFGHFTISQTYDFLKADEWKDRDVEPDTTEERQLYALGNIRFDATVNPFYNVYFSATLEYDPYFNSFSNGYIYGHTKTRDWKFGVRWDYTKNFENEIYDFHALALEGGSKLGEHWSFSAWVKYDFSQSYFPYANLDLIYNSQCWGITLHTYYKNDRVQDFITGDYIDSNEVRFGISISLKNVDSVDTNSFGDFDW